MHYSGIFYPEVDHLLANGFFILANGLLKLDKGFFFIRNMGFVMFLMEFPGLNPVIPVVFVWVTLLVLDVMLLP